MTDKVLTDICDRLSTLEAIVLGRAGGVRGGGDRRLSKREVAIREGKTTRTITRWVAMGIYPPPDNVNGRDVWWLSVVQRHDRKRLRESRAAPPRGPVGRSTATRG
jgi:hypothetical protein